MRRIRRLFPLRPSTIATISAALALLAAPFLPPKLNAQSFEPDTAAPADPNSTGLFFATTARTAPAGTGYVGATAFFPMTSVALPYAGLGVAKRINVSAGMLLLPVESGSTGYVGLKAALVDRPGGALAVGGLTTLGSAVRSRAGLVYGVATVGREDASVTLSATWEWERYAGAETHFSREPLVMFGGKARISRHSMLISENYMIPGGDGVAGSLGVRVFGGPLSLDVGAAGAIGNGDIACCYPVVNVSTAFDLWRRPTVDPASLSRTLR